MGESPNYPPPFLIDQQGSDYNSSMLFCGFFIIATAGIILAIYHCLALQWCSDYPHSWPGITLDSAVAAIDNSSNACKITKLDSVLFKYKKHQQEEEDEECVVCLSVFEDDEDVRKLVRCKHSFHALCIDMWLFSHFDCPLCRAPVGGGSDGGGGGGGGSMVRNSGLVVMPGGDRNERNPV